MADAARPETSFWVRLTYRVSSAFLWLFCKVWFRLGARGQETVPRRGPVLLAANRST